MFYKCCALLYPVFVAALVPSHSTLCTLLFGTVYTLGGRLPNRYNKCLVINRILKRSFVYCSLSLFLLLHLCSQLEALSHVDDSCWPVNVHVFFAVLSFCGRIIHI